MTGRNPEATRSVGTSPAKPKIQSKPLSFMLKQLLSISPDLMKRFGKNLIPHYENEKDSSIDIIETG